MGDVDPNEQQLSENGLDRLELESLESGRLGLPLHRCGEDYSETG